MSIKDMNIKNDWFVLVQYFSTSFTATTSKSQGEHNFPPLGLMNISSVAQLHGYKPYIIDLLATNRNLKTLVNNLKKLQKKHGKPPQIIGFTAYTENVVDILQACKIIKKLYPDTLMVLGGTHAKAKCTDILANHYIDMVSLIEGECHIIEILKYQEGYYAIEKVQGIAYRSNGHIRVTDRQLLSDLDLPPLPDLFNINLSDYIKSGIIISSRGCPGKCIFCASPSYYGNQHRAYSAQRIYAEMILYNKYFKFNKFGFQDDTFTILIRRTKELHELLKSRKNFTFTIKSRVDTLNDKILSYLKSANCSLIHIGLESTDDKVLSILKKHTTVEKNLQALEKIASYGITPKCTFIIGSPGDTEKSIYKNIILCYLINKYFGPKSSFFSYCTPFPDTELYCKAEEYNINIKVKDWRRYDFYVPIFDSKSFKIDFLMNVQLHYDMDPHQFIQTILARDPELKDYFNEKEERVSNAYEKYKKKSQHEIRTNQAS